MAPETEEAYQQGSSLIARVQTFVERMKRRIRKLKKQSERAPGSENRDIATPAPQQVQSSTRMDAYEQARAAFQKRIDSLHDGETLELSPHEFPCPVAIKHPIVLEGRGATLWALKGPVISVEPEGVVLRDLRIEVTGEEGSNNPEENCAILVQHGKGIRLENIQVRGSVIGLPEEEGDWSYPFSLQIGKLAYGKEHDFIIRVVVPVPCRLKSNISGLEVSPHSLKAGANEVRLHLEHLPQDTLLSGVVALSTAFLERHFTVTAHVVPAQSGQAVAIQGNKQIIWEPTDWAKRISEQPSQPKPPAIPVEPHDQLPAPKGEIKVPPLRPEPGAPTRPSSPSPPLSVPPPVPRRIIQTSPVSELFSTPVEEKRTDEAEIDETACAPSSPRVRSIPRSDIFKQPSPQDEKDDPSGINQPKEAAHSGSNTSGTQLAKNRIVCPGNLPPLFTEDVEVDNEE